MSNHVNVDWHEALKKRARGIDTNHIITRKGLLKKRKFYLPKKIVEKIEENGILFNVTEDEAEIYKS